MKIENANYYDEYLLSLVPKLRQFPSKSGGEGTAYFIDDKFVVKEMLYKFDENIFSFVFNDYCAEMQKFAKQGYKVPKIYSWLQIPNEKKLWTENEYLYYILEERVPGREIYFNSVNEIYELCKHLCSKDEFEGEWINNKFTPLLKKIYETYIKDYIETNEKVESMSDADLEKFFDTIFVAADDARYYFPDLNFRNIMIDKDQINLIDLRSTCDNNLADMKKHVKHEIVIFDLIKVMYNNYELSKIISKNIISDHQIINLLEENNKLVKEVFIKSIKLLKNKIEFKNGKSGVIFQINQILGREQAKDVIEMI